LTLLFKKKKKITIFFFSFFQNEFHFIFHLKMADGGLLGSFFDAIGKFIKPVIEPLGDKLGKTLAPIMEPVCEAIANNVSAMFSDPKKLAEVAAVVVAAATATKNPGAGMGAAAKEIVAGTSATTVVDQVMKIVTKT
jgi:nitrate/nitrite transporter NarK